MGSSKSSRVGFFAVFLRVLSVPEVACRSSTVQLRAISVLRSLFRLQLEHDLVFVCNEHGTIYAISSDFGDRMTTQHLD